MYEGKPVVYDILAILVKPLNQIGYINNIVNNVTGIRII